jgi:hypothetical protein
MNTPGGGMMTPEGLAARQRCRGLAGGPLWTSEPEVDEIAGNLPLERDLAQGPIRTQCTCCAYRKRRRPLSKQRLPPAPQRERQ